MNLKSFINEFVDRKGTSLFFSSVIEKIGGFLLVLIATRIISESEYGFITYANTSLLFIIPFIGFGIHQGLVRYGSLSKSQINKKYLFNIVLKRGLLYSILLLVLFIVFIPLITVNLKDSKIYLFILSFQLISFFVYEIVRIYTRLIHVNKLNADITNVKTILMVLTAFVLTFFFDGIGYAISLAVIPFVVSFYYIVKLRLLVKIIPSNIGFKLSEFLNYGMFAALGGVLSNLLYAVDVLLIGNLLIDERLIAQYKVSNILPFSFLFLALVFIKTNFVKIAHRSAYDKAYIKNYYYNYLKIFSFISLAIVLFFFLFSDYLIKIFGDTYTNENGLMQIFAIGVAGALLFRIPLGNLLAAIGWPKINALNSFVILLLNLGLSYVFIMKHGIIGAAYVTSFLLWFSGFLSLGAFWWYLKK